MVSAFENKKTFVPKIPPERINRQVPRWLDIGTVSCYFTFDELVYIEKALDIARDHLVNTMFGENMPDLQEYELLEERVADYKKMYERRMKNAK